MNIFLKAKHWQLFIFNFAIPFVLYFVAIIITIGLAVTQQINSPEFGLRMIPFYILIGLISAAVRYLWTWAAGIQLNKRLPEELQMNSIFFKICFFYPIVYVPLIILVVLTVIYPGSEFFPFGFLLLIPFHLFAIFCSFYCYYFVARVIKTNELGQHAYISDYIAEVFMIWFFFVGIWFLQPKINKMVSATDNLPIT
ncbi:MAG: hypothetical protein IMY74_03540 [Bacteroidetes bacterium]|nr:hypothetical protein [Bacteroidota bacterium]MCK5766546.1 hypothetical protein [Bacteroidales bacterium]